MKEMNISLSSEKTRTSKDAVKECLSSAFKLPLTRLEMAESICLFLLGILSCVITSYSSGGDQIQVTISVLNLFMGIYGAIFIHLRLTTKRKLYLFPLLWLIPTIALFCILIEQPEELTGIIVLLYLSAFGAYFFMLRFLREFVLQIFGTTASRISSMAMNTIVFIFFSMMIWTYFDDTTKGEGLAKVTISTIGFFYILMTITLWIQNTRTSFAYYTPQEYLMVKEAYKERPYDIDHIINCGKLIEENNSWVSWAQEKSHIIFSSISLIAIVAIEIALIVILTNFSADPEQYFAAALYIGIVPGLFLIMVGFSSARIHKDDRILTSTVVGGMFVVVFQPLSIQFENIGYDGIVLFLRWGPPICSLLLLSLILLFQYNKRCYQLLIPIFLFVFGVSLGLLSVVYLTEDNEVTSAVVHVLIALLCLTLLGFFWCLGTITKFKALMSVFFHTSGSVNWFDIVQFTYCSMFIWSLNLLIYFYIEVDQRNDTSYRRGLLLTSILALVFIFGMTAYILKVVFYVKKKNCPEPTLKEIDETNPYAEEIKKENSPFYILYRRNKRFEIAMLSSALIISLFIMIGCLIQGEQYMMTFGFSVLACFFLIGIVSTLMLKLKRYLMNFGKLYLAYSCGGCWCFVILPIFVMGPIVLSFMGEDNQEDMESLSLWATGLVFIMILGGVSSLSIFLNNVLNKIEEEMLTRKCIDAVSEKLDKYRMKASKDVIRIIYEYYVKYGEDVTVEILMDDTLVSVFDINSRTETFNKILVPFKAAEKMRETLARQKTRTQELPADSIHETDLLIDNDMIVEYENIEKNEGKSCFDFIKKLLNRTKVDTVTHETEEANLYPSLENDIEEEYIEMNFRRISSRKVTQAEKYAVMQEKQYLLMDSDPSKKDHWVDVTYQFFSTESTFDEESFLKFVDLSGIQNNKNQKQIEKIKNDYFLNGSVSFTVFKTLLIERLALMMFDNSDEKMQNRLFKEYIYPNLALNVPMLRTALTKFSVDFMIGENRPQAMFEIDQTANEVNVDLPLGIDIEDLMDLPDCFEKFISCFSNVLELVLWFLLRLVVSLIHFCVPFRNKEDKVEPDASQEREPALQSFFEDSSWAVISEDIVSTFKGIISENENLYSSSSFQWNSANVTAIIENVIELFTFCVIAFHSAAGWGDRFSYLSTISETLLGEENQYRYLFIGCFIFILIFYCVSGEINKLIRQGKLGRDEHMNKASLCSKSFFYEKAASLFAKTLYSTIMIAVLTGLSCRLLDGDWVMIANPNQTCFEGEHYFYLIVGVFGMLFYYPRASLLYPKMQYQNWALDLKYTPTFLVIESQGKLIIAGVSVFFEKSEYLWIQLLVVIAFCSALAMLCHYSKPCIMKEYNQVKALSYLIPVWVCLCALLNFSIMNSDGFPDFIEEHHVDILFYMLVVGVALLFIVLIIMTATMNRIQRKSIMRRSTMNESIMHDNTRFINDDSVRNPFN